MTLYASREFLKEMAAINNEMFATADYSYLNLFFFADQFLR